MDLTQLATESRNPKTMNLDELSSMEILRIMNEEDKKIPLAIEKELTAINSVIQEIIRAFNRGGRLIYMGAGTSGRLGILDAAECVPTFGTDPDMVQGLIAGGESAMTIAVEGAEDSKELAIEDLEKINLTDKDIVIGIAASGRTPYVIGGLEYASSLGVMTASVSCNKKATISKYAKLPIEVEPGPEILTGSTRLKAGTSQKLVLNMLSTVSMIGIGKVYNNLMVDVKPTNEKLVERSMKIIMEATCCQYETAEKYFIEADKNVKLAIMMILTGDDKVAAAKCLEKGNGFIKKSIN